MCRRVMSLAARRRAGEPLLQPAQFATQDGPHIGAHSLDRLHALSGGRRVQPRVDQVGHIRAAALRSESTSLKNMPLRVFEVPIDVEELNFT